MTVKICQSFSPNSFGLHFREREETIKEKKAKIRTYKKTYKWAGKIWWESTFGTKFQKQLLFLQILV